jgi:hypothetical protein
LVVWVLLGIASVAWWPVYRSDTMVLAGSVAIVAGTVIAAAGAVLRWSAPTVALSTVIAFTLLGVPTAVPGEANGVLPTVPGLSDLFSGVALGWKQLVTISLPVGNYEALLVPYFALMLVATVVAVSVAVRAKRQESACFAAVVVFVAGVIFGATSLEYSVATGLALAGGALVWALTARHVRRAVSVASTVGTRVSVARGIVRPALVGTATVAAACVIAWGIGFVASPTGEREVARSTVVRPFDPQDYVSPLSNFRSYEESPEVDRTQLTVTGLPANGFVRIATLDTYNGVVYSVGGPTGSSASGSFERVPTSVDVAANTGKNVDIRVDVAGYSGVWLPTVGDLKSVAFDGKHAAAQRGEFFYNRTTGTGAVLGGVSSGTSYRLHALIPSQPTTAQLSKASPGSARVPTPKNVPNAVDDTVQSYTKGIDGSGARLVEMLKDLKANGYVSHGVGNDRPSASGHSAARIQTLLTANPMVGDAEQYAVAASLMAQDLGFPTRVVLGFAPSQTSSASSGTLSFTGSDITARIEVDTAQYGWVLLDPNPAVRPIPAQQLQTPKPVTRPETIVPPPPVQQQDQNNQNQPQADRKTPPTEPLWLTILLGALPWALATLAFIALVLLPFAIIVIMKRLRRRRRARAPSGRSRIVGAWDEYRDALVDHGHDLLPTATRREVAQAAPGDRAAGLARLADRAVFGPSEVDDSAADRMWTATEAAIAELSDGRSRWQRFRDRTSLRSLAPGLRLPWDRRSGGYDGLKARR